MSPKIIKWQRLHHFKYFSDRGYIAKKFQATEAMSHNIFKVEYLGEFKAIFINILGSYSWTPGWLNCEKNWRWKISWHYPFKEVLYFHFFIKYSISPPFQELMRQQVLYFSANPTQNTHLHSTVHISTLMVSQHLWKWFFLLQELKVTGSGSIVV